MSAGSSEQAALDRELPQKLGRYTLCHEIGAGGMATVYLAKMSLAAGLSRIVALKTVHPHLARERQFLDMFLDEAKIASMISHPNVSAVYDFGCERGTYFIAMEYLVGEPLFDVVNAIVKKRDETMLAAVPFLSARLIADACEGLHAAHTLRGQDGKSLDVVHRDVSPQNIFVTYDGSVKVVDFGCAKALERVTQTNAGVMKGKVSYAAPEQLRADPLDARADVFALGVCLWESLTLRQLFRRETQIKTARAVLEDAIPRATENAPWVSEELADIAAKALERDRAKRYGSARELGRALRAYIARSATPFESAEVADWMAHLFSDRQQRALELVGKVEALDLSHVEPVPSREAIEPAVTKTAKTPPPRPAREREAPAPAPEEDDEPLRLPTRSRGYAYAAVGALLVLAAAAVGYWKFQGPIHEALGAGGAPAEPAPEPPAPEEVVAPAPAPEPSPEVHEALHESAHEAAGPLPVSPVAAPAQNAAQVGATAQRPVGARPGQPLVQPGAGPAAPPPARQGPTLDFSRGPVQIDTPGGWAIVQHEGRELGRTPLRVTLPVGRQRVRLLPFGEGPPRDVEVEVEWGVLHRVNVRLEAPRGTEGWSNPY
jgi:serine/threonine protein kinase